MLLTIFYLILRVLKYILLFTLGLFIIIFVLLALDRDYISEVRFGEVEKKQIKIQKQYTNPNKEHLQALKTSFGENKELPKGFEAQALLALSHYPELKKTHIKFLIQPAWIPLSSRPDPWTVLFPWRKKVYLIVISSKSVDFLEPILLKNLEFNQQVGVLGHELAHTVSYIDKSSLNLTTTAVSYLWLSFRKRFERATDKRAIAHGLGYQLHDYAKGVRKLLHKANAMGVFPKKIKDAEESYLNPQEILEEMKKYKDWYKD